MASGENERVGLLLAGLVAGVNGEERKMPFRQALRVAQGPESVEGQNEK